MALELRFELALGVELERALEAVAVLGFEAAVRDFEAVALAFDRVAALGFAVAFGFEAVFGFAAAFDFEVAFGFAAAFGFEVAFGFAAAFGFEVVFDLDAGFALVVGFAEPLELFFEVGAEPFDGPLPPRVRDVLCADLLFAANFSPFDRYLQAPIYPLLTYFKPQRGCRPSQARCA